MASVAKRFLDNPSGFRKGLDNGGGDQRTAAAAAVPPAPLAAAVGDNGAADGFMAALQEAPPRHLTPDYLINCELPADQCDALWRCKDAVAEETRTQIDLCGPESESVENVNLTLSITGLLPDVYTAHLRLMMAYNDGVERRAEEEERAAEELEKSEKVQKMQDQIAQLQAQLNKHSAAATQPAVACGAARKGSHKGGKGKSRR